jgi:hypothetical protein
MDEAKRRYSLLDKTGKSTGRYFTGKNAREAAKHVVSRSKGKLKSGSKIILRQSDKNSAKRKYCYVVGKKKGGKKKQIVLSACRSSKGSRKGSRKGRR